VVPDAARGKKEAWEEATRGVPHIGDPTQATTASTSACGCNIIEAVAEPPAALWRQPPGDGDARCAIRHGRAGRRLDTPEEADERVKLLEPGATRKTPIGLAMNPAISTSAT
jgi:hypothetical protein